MMEDGWTPTTSKSLPSHHCLLSVHSKSARATADNGWLPTYTEEPAATSPSTVGRHYESARPTADDGWTPMGVEQRAATSPSNVFRHSRSARPTADDG